MNEEKNNQNTNNRIKAALQGFMNSIDLKIIKKIQIIEMDKVLTTVQVIRLMGQILTNFWININFHNIRIIY